MRTANISDIKYIGSIALLLLDNGDNISFEWRMFEYILEGECYKVKGRNISYPNKKDVIYFNN